MTQYCLKYAYIVVSEPNAPPVAVAGNDTTIIIPHDGIIGFDPPYEEICNAYENEDDCLSGGEVEDACSWLDNPNQDDCNLVDNETDCIYDGCNWDEEAGCYNDDLAEFMKYYLKIKIAL